MQWVRTTFALMLILALVPAVSLMPPSSGQVYVTVTTQTSTTGFYTHPVTTIYENRTVSVYVAMPLDFALNVCGQGARDDREFLGVKGQSYRIEWTTSGSIPLDLYITTAFPNFDNSGCNEFEEPSGAALAYVIYHTKGASGSVDWVAPSTGAFVAWIFNFSVENVNGLGDKDNCYGHGLVN